MQIMPVLIFEPNVYWNFKTNHHHHERKEIRKRTFLSFVGKPCAQGEGGDEYGFEEEQNYVVFIGNLSTLVLN